MPTTQELDEFQRAFAAWDAAMKERFELLRKVSTGEPGARDELDAAARKAEALRLIVERAAKSFDQTP